MIADAKSIQGVQRFQSSRFCSLGAINMTGNLGACPGSSVVCWIYIRQLVGILC